MPLIQPNLSGPITSARWQQVEATFQQIWGYQSFRPPQGEIVRSLLQGQDAVVVMPTGGGKSICFQLPALLSQGLTLVISPLVALMENQVDELRQRQLPAATLHGELSKRSRWQTLRDLEQQRLRLLYLSPETLLSPAVWERLCHPALKINGLVLDEAHCLVQWGDTFRPAYQRLGAVRPALLAQRPGTQIAIAAFTATADPKAIECLKTTLQLRQPQVVQINPHRANLHLAVQPVWTPRDRYHRLLKGLNSRGDQAGLVYVRTRQDSEKLAASLKKQGFCCAAYHAGLAPAQRRQLEADWIADRLQFVVSTSAFGMGINKPNCRWVIHFQAPGLLSEYVQEVGRAGRDGKPARTLTLVSERTGWLDNTDQQRAQYFDQRQEKIRQNAQRLARQLPEQGTVAEVSSFQHGAIALAYLHRTGQLQWLDPFTYRLMPKLYKNPLPATKGYQQMQRYLHSRQCRWQHLLNQFGFQPIARQMAQQTGGCGRCDNCQR
ncbi:MAG: RecQ family ATP-dependent DNA helicase [Cyanobacteria bacterium P01_H01_bin.119]